MKKITLFLIPLFFVSCMGRITAVKDDFKNATVLTMDLRQGSEESLIKGGGLASFRYSKEIKNNQPSLTIISLFIQKGKLPFGGSQDLQRDAIIKIDGKSYDVALNEISAVNVTTISGQPNYATGGTQITSSQHEEWNTKLQLTKQIESDILKGESVAIRIYFGTNPMTFVLKNIEKVKEFISLTQEP